METSNEILDKLKQDVKSKLSELNPDNNYDCTLIDYILVMVVNQKSKYEMKHNLALFLGKISDDFVNWLFEHLQQIKMNQENDDHCKLNPPIITITTPSSSYVHNTESSKNDLQELAAGKLQKENKDILQLNKSDKSSYFSINDSTTKDRHQSNSISSSKQDPVPSEHDVHFSLDITQPTKNVSQVKKSFSTINPKKKLKSIVNKVIGNSVEENNRIVQSDERVYDDYIDDDSTMVPDNINKRKRTYLSNNLQLQATAYQNKMNYHQAPKRQRSAVEKTANMANNNNKKKLGDHFEMDHDDEHNDDCEVEQQSRNESSIVDGKSTKNDAQTVIHDENVKMKKNGSPSIHDNDVHDDLVQQKQTKFYVTLEGVKNMLKDDLFLLDEEELDPELMDEDLNSGEKSSGGQKNGHNKKYDHKSSYHGQSNITSNIKMERCRYWPSCMNGNKCDYHHPIIKCNLFPNCRFGDKCLYIHPICKFDSLCSRKEYCPYFHTTTSIKRNGISAGMMISPAPPPILTGSPTNNIVCKYFPKCVNPLCEFFHPKTECHFGLACKTLNCRFVHPNQQQNLPHPSQLKWSSSKNNNSTSSSSRSEIEINSN